MPAENSAGASEITSDDVAAPAAVSGRRPMSAAPASPGTAPVPAPARASDLRPAAAAATPAVATEAGSPRDTSARPDKQEKNRTTTPEERKPNMVRRIRIERMMSKAELARSANLSVLTIDRVEKGFGCRVDTKRKILEALGLSLADRVRVFGEEE
jgi:ribosome-binding protein aMBF1 (putative translation factor)